MRYVERLVSTSRQAALLRERRAPRARCRGYTAKARRRGRRGCWEVPARLGTARLRCGQGAAPSALWIQIERFAAPIGASTEVRSGLSG